MISGAPFPDGTVQGSVDRMAALPSYERKRVLLYIADQINQRKDQFTYAIVREAGKVMHTRACSNHNVWLTNARKDVGRCLCRGWARRRHLHVCR